MVLSCNNRNNEHEVIRGEIIDIYSSEVIVMDFILKFR